MEGDSKAKLALQAIEEKMRVQIRSLQEKRAAAMMGEIAELQRDRDLTTGRVAALEKVITSLQHQNTELKRKEKKKQALIESLERSLNEEQMITKDLKKKLLKLQADAASRKGEKAIPFLRPHLTNIYYRDRSQSMSDLRTILDKDKTSESQNSSPKVVSQLNSSPSISPTGSPSLVIRRYKLAAANITSDQETQTESIAYDDNNTENLPQPVLGVLTLARQDLLKVQEQNKELRAELQRSKIEKQELEGDINNCMEECSVLRNSLSQFSQWVQEKISSVQEDIDICKVIYTLHGSLSREMEAIQELQDKLSTSEASVRKITREKKILAKSYSEIEQRLRESQAEVSELKEELNALPKYSDSVASQYKTQYTPSPLLQQKHLDFALKTPTVSEGKHSKL